MPDRRATHRRGKTRRSSDDPMMAEWFWIDRWMGSSAFLLPLEARGLYREMLTQAWRRGARLPADHAAIRRATGCAEDEWARSWPLIANYWVVRDGWLVNETQVEIYDESVAIRRQAAEKGAKGGRASAQKRAHSRTEVEANAQARRQADTQAKWQADAQAKQQARSEAGDEANPPADRQVEGQAECKPLTLTLNVPATDPPDQQQVPRRVGGAPPLPLGLRRFQVWQWMLDDLAARLGDHATRFDLEAWLRRLDAGDDAIVPRPQVWPWLQRAFVDACQDAGLPVVVAPPTAAPANRWAPTVNRDFYRDRLRACQHEPRCGSSVIHENRLALDEARTEAGVQAVS